jgi:hypothetical protein
MLAQETEDESMAVQTTLSISDVGDFRVQSRTLA